ncbi:MAG: transposase [Opitutaceae bacterium]|nr:transposase [Opitutaceae bacterium]
MKLEQVSLLVGLDWADQAHTCSWQRPDGSGIGQAQVAAAPERLGAWFDQLRGAHPQGQIVVVLERPDGPVVELLRARPGFVIVAVNPLMLHRFRQAFSPSGAKDDPGDARLLAEIVRTHPERFAALAAPEPRLRTLATLVRHRRDWIDRRTGLVEQLSATLKQYYPQALTLAGADLASPMTRAFLRRWPDLAAVQRSRWGTLARFYRRHHAGRAAVLARREALVRQAQPVNAHADYVAPWRLQMQTILGQLEALAASLARYEAVIAQAYADAPGRTVIDSLPGVGPVLAPRLWVACQQAGSTPRAKELAQRSGIAPVQRQSGQSQGVFFRRARPRFLHQTWTEFAAHSTAACPWAKAYHDQRLAQGDGLGAIRRALAFKWTRIIARLWRDQVPYDDQYYTAHRAARLTAA